jgi:hypothetical protein
MDYLIGKYGFWMNSIFSIFVYIGLFHDKVSDKVHYKVEKLYPSNNYVFVINKGTSIYFYEVTFMDLKKGHQGFVKEQKTIFEVLINESKVI